MLTTVLSYFGATSCAEQSFFGLPTWYKYLLKNGHMKFDTITQRCEIADSFEIGHFSLIGLALVDIVLRVAALVAVAFVIYGGIQFVTAQGESDKTKKARQTIINALIGLVIALISTGFVSFIAAQVGKP